MPANTRELKGRIRAVGNIQRITKTMQMIATARFQSLQRKATQARAFSRKLAQVVGEIASSLGEETSVDLPLLRPAKATENGKDLLLVITSNRGLCGGYNANLLRTLTRFLNDHDRERIDIHMVGKKGVAYAKFTRLQVAQTHAQFGEQPEYADVNALAEKYMHSFIAGEYDTVSVLYMAFESMSRQRPHVMQLLPLQPPEKQADESAASTVQTDYEFSPDPQQLLSDLLPMTVKMQLFQCFNEAAVSEQLARMVAMKSATDAAGKQKKSLNRQYNRARQAAITTELTEIISGSEAAQG